MGLLCASVWRHVAAGAALALLAGVGTAAAAPTPPVPGLGDSPADVAAAGPQDLTAIAASERPVSGTTSSAGPKFSKSGSVWRVITPQVVLRNTVTDADGDTANLTFQVYTTNADGTPRHRSTSTGRVATGFWCLRMWLPAVRQR